MWESSSGPRPRGENPSGPTCACSSPLGRAAVAIQDGSGSTSSIAGAVWEEPPVHRPAQAPQAAELVARAGLRGMSGPYQDADMAASARQVEPEYLPDRAGSDDQIIHVAIIHKNIWICEGDGGAARPRLALLIYARFLRFACLITLGAPT